MAVASSQTVAPRPNQNWLESPTHPLVRRCTPGWIAPGTDSPVDSPRSAQTCQIPGTMAYCRFGSGGRCRVAVVVIIICGGTVPSPGVPHLPRPCRCPRASARRHAPLAAATATGSVYSNYHRSWYYGKQAPRVPSQKVPAVEVPRLHLPEWVLLLLFLSWAAATGSHTTTHHGLRHE